MSELRNLKWGEKHLCGDLFTIKISLGQDLCEKVNGPFRDLGLTVLSLTPSKKHHKIRYMAYGVLNYDKFQKYLVIKNEAQATLLIRQAAFKLEDVKIRKEQIKHNETVKTLVPVEPIEAC